MTIEEENKIEMDLMKEVNMIVVGANEEEKNLRALLSRFSC